MWFLRVCPIVREREILRIGAGGCRLKVDPYRVDVCLAAQIFSDLVELGIYVRHGDAEPLQVLERDVSGQRYLVYIPDRTAVRNPISTVQ